MLFIDLYNLFKIGSIGAYMNGRLRRIITN